MYIYDKYWNIVEDPDLELGRVEEEVEDIVIYWVVDEEAVYEEQVIAEYPETGGKDVAWVETVPEKGHWEKSFVNDPNLEGRDVPFEIDIPEDMPKDEAVVISYEYGKYIPYTEEELEEIEEQKRIEQEEANKQAARDALIDGLKEWEAVQDDFRENFDENVANNETVASIMDAMCDMDVYMHEWVSSVEDALCELDMANEGIL